MKLQHYSSEKLSKEIANIVFKYLDPKKNKLFFFGSRVAGTNFERSDIDLGIEGIEPIDAKTFLTIEEELENLPILYKIDVVDFKDVGKLFYKIASKHREFIN